MYIAIFDSSTNCAIIRPNMYGIGLEVLVIRFKNLEIISQTPLSYSNQITANKTLTLD